MNNRVNSSPKQMENRHSAPSREHNYRNHRFALFLKLSHSNGIETKRHLFHDLLAFTGDSCTRLREM